MTDSTKAVSSLARFKHGRRTLYVLPVRGVIYGMASVVVVFLLLLAIDRLVLGSLERGGWTAGELWARHNKIVEDNHRRKTTTNECELRHWSGQPLPAEPSDPAAPRPRKILVMGDSFVWGPPYVTLNHLWWRQLAIELERRGYRNVQIVAAGHPGWSTHRQLECAKQLIPEIKPDLVIWGYVTNDPDEKLVPKIFDLQDKSPFGQRIRVRLKRVLPNVMFKFESLRNDKLAEQYAGPEYGYAYADWELKLLEGPNFEAYRQTVQEVSAFMRQSKIPAFLHTLPHFPCREYFEPRYGPVLKEWLDAGFVVNSTLDSFISHYGNASPTGPDSIRWGINPSDSHPGPQATYFHAVMAADFLEQIWPELLGPKDTRQPHELVINDWLPDDLNVRQTGMHSNMHTFEIDYPATANHMPQLPGPPAALIALQYPMPIIEVGLAGTGLQKAQVWALLQPEERFEEDKWHELEAFDSDPLIFLMPANIATRRISALRFTADIRGPDRQLKLSLTPAEAASSTE